MNVFSFFFFFVGCCIPQRVIMAIMCFLAIAIAYVMRVCLSVAITQMVVAVNTTTTGSTKGICLADPPKNDSEKPVN